MFWDISGMVGGATPPSVRIISSNMPPTATFTFSPGISGVGER